MSETDTSVKAPGPLLPGAGLAPVNAPPVPTKVTPGSPQKLDDVLLAMDVVDTIRHREQVVDVELSAEERETDLINRLKEIYAAQGMDVPDRILKEGVKALDEHRFAYTPPDPNRLAVKLAKAYINRGKWLPQTAGLIFLAVLGVGVWQGTVYLQEGEWRRTPAEITELSTNAQALAIDPAVDTRIASLANAAMIAYQQNDRPAVKEDLTQLRQISTQLSQDYDVRVVNRDDESSGVWRYHDATNGRSYYLIVEGVTPGGKALKLPITSEETQKTKTVDKWGQRVPKETFDKIAEEKADNHIIEDAVLGHKSRGELDPRFTQRVLPGAITEW
jgi:hypothetical protein